MFPSTLLEFPLYPTISAEDRDYAVNLPFEEEEEVDDDAFLVRYPPGSNYEAQYPEITKVLKTIVPELANNQKLVEALMKYGSLTEQQVKDALEWGNANGPEIVIEPLGGLGWAVFDNEEGTKNVIRLNSDLEGIFNGTFLDPHFPIPENTSYEALAFFVAFTTVHELTHWGDYNNNGNLHENWTFPGGQQGDDEEGDAFDWEMVEDFGGMEPADAEDILNRFILRTKD